MTNTDRDAAILGLAALTHPDGSARLPGLRVECEGRWVNGMGAVAGRYDRGPLRHLICVAPRVCRYCGCRGWNPIDWRNERTLKQAVEADGWRIMYHTILHEWLASESWMIYRVNGGAEAFGDELIDATDAAYAVKDGAK